MRLMMSRKLRQRFYYKVEIAGAKAGLSRSESYRAAWRGDIPVERFGRLLLVPRKQWDREVKRLLRGQRAKSRRYHKSAPAEANAT